MEPKHFIGAVRLSLVIGVTLAAHIAWGHILMTGMCFVFALIAALPAGWIAEHWLVQLGFIEPVEEIVTRTEDWQ